MDCCHIVDPVTRPFDLVVLVTMGLTISLGHCVGMCGPLVSAVALAQRQRGHRTVGILGHGLLYHCGRIVAYALLGAAMGLLGSTVFLGDTGRRVEGGLSLVVALVMVVLGIAMTGRLRVGAWIERLPWQDRVLCTLREALAAPTLGRAWWMGFANGFLPCGPVFAAAMTAAATSDPFKGAIAMLAFGAGTIPMLLFVGAGAARLGVLARTRLTRIGAALVMLVAVQLALRGLAAWDLVGHLRWGEVVFW